MTNISTLGRREAVEILLRDRGDLLVVTGLGSPSYDVHAAGDHASTFYLWGAMGAAALVGLGIAQGRRDRKVVVVTGDGEQLMGLGGLATIGVANPNNLTVVVIDNKHFGETGMQKSHTGRGLSLAEMARAAGFVDTRTVGDRDGVAGLAAALQVPADGPRLFVIEVAADSPPRSLPARDAVYLKNRFRAHLGLGVS